MGGGDCRDNPYNCADAANPLPTASTVWIEEMTWMDVRDALKAGKTTAIISTGGIEPNGPWLVTGKHNYVLRANCDAIARKLGNALCAPIIEYVPEGDIDPKGGHMSSPGTISMREETFQAVLTDVAHSLKMHGFKNIIFIGDSGGNQRGQRTVGRKANARFSFVLTKNRQVSRAIGSIPDHAWSPVRYPGAVEDPDTGELLSDAEVAEMRFTAFTSTPHPVTARLIVRRVRDRAKAEELFPVWRYHPFLTNSTEPTAQADITHRRHAIIETTFADLIDGPLAHLPSGRFATNGAWAICAAITHNLLRAAGTLAGPAQAVARGASLRRQLITIPSRIARPQRRRVRHMPQHWPWAQPWLTLWTRVFGHGPAPPIAA